MTKSETTPIHGPWVAESNVSIHTEERGLAVIAVLPELARIPGATPTRGMVAWVHSGLGACETDGQAVATARLISAAPDLLDAIRGLIDFIEIDSLPMNQDALQIARAAIAKAEACNE